MQAVSCPEGLIIPLYRPEDGVLHDLTLRGRSQHEVDFAERILSDARQF